eukprot:2621596-Rhodomonas_salina.1
MFSPISCWASPTDPSPTSQATLALARGERRTGGGTWFLPADSIPNTGTPPLSVLPILAVKGEGVSFPSHHRDRDGAGPAGRTTTGLGS